MKRFSLAFLKDAFLSVNNRVNGYEHQLARRSKEFRETPTNHVDHFPNKSGCGPQETARRRRQMGLPSVAAKRFEIAHVHEFTEPGVYGTSVCNGCGASDAI